MTVNEVVRILNARVLVEGDMEAEIKTACGSDMMSDVLAFVKDQALLLTGLMQPAGDPHGGDDGHGAASSSCAGKAPDEAILEPG